MVTAEMLKFWLHGDTLGWDRLAVILRRIADQIDAGARPIFRVWCLRKGSVPIIPP